MAIDMDKLQEFIGRFVADLGAQPPVGVAGEPHGVEVDVVDGGPVAVGGGIIGYR